MPAHCRPDQDDPYIQAAVDTWKFFLDHQALPVSLMVGALADILRSSFPPNPNGEAYNVEA